MSSTVIPVFRQLGQLFSGKGPATLAPIDVESFADAAREELRPYRDRRGAIVCRFREGEEQDAFNNVVGAMPEDDPVRAVAFPSYAHVSRWEWSFISPVFSASDPMGIYGCICAKPRPGYKTLELAPV